MTAFTYFAYGSNMLTARLRARVKDCTPQGTAKLSGYVLRFHKRSRDGTGKCNALYTGDPADFVLGVLFSIAQAHRAALDSYEGAGKGYDAVQVEVAPDSGAPVRALTYLAGASHIDDQLRPTSEYFEYVLQGAREHGLPEAYIASKIIGFERDLIADESRSPMTKISTRVST